MQEIESLFRELITERYCSADEELDLNEIDLASHDLLELVMEVEEKFEVSFSHEDLETITSAFELLQLLLYCVLKNACEQLTVLLANNPEDKATVAKLQQLVHQMNQERELLTTNLSKLELPSNVLPLFHNLVNHSNGEIQEQAATALQVIEGE